MSDPDSRLTELEIALTHQQRLADELSEQAGEMAARIERLERGLAALARRLAEAEAAARGTPPDERPPHW